MKKILSLLVAVFISSMFCQAQTIEYTEDFESAPYNVVETTTGSVNWSLNSSYYSQGSNSYSSVVEQNDSSMLTTTTIDCSGNNFVLLEFDHICKIYVLDAAEIFVSGDNGVNWTKLDGSHYLGNSQFTAQGNKFTSSAYTTLWDPSNPTSINNSWWKTEAFDISSIAGNSSQVKIQFLLRDGNGLGAQSYLGWFIDNINVTVAIDELVPPTISLINPYPKDTVYNAGPFNVKADITDASGIDTAMLIYTYNNNTPDTLGMIYLSGNTYTATIPSINLYDTVCYYIYAIDQSLVSNEAHEPSSSCHQFIYKTSPPPPGCTSPITSFPFFENFDSSPSAIPSGWYLQTSGSTAYTWRPNSGSTSSSSTGPSGDHTSGTGVYLYTETNSGVIGDSTILVTPCMDIRSLTAPKLKFWYHMYGSAMGTLAVDIFYGNGYIQNIWTLSGDQGDEWKMAVVDLTPYKSITEIRFRGIKAGSTYGDMAIDDVMVYDPPADDAGIASIDNPVSPGMTGIQNIEVSLENGGSQTLSSADIYWEINGVPQTTFNWSGTLPAGDTIHNLIIGTYNFAVGPTNIKAWSSNPNGNTDTYPLNDTVSKTVMVCGGGLAGSYTIGGTSPDYTNIGEAVYALNECGIAGPVLFNIRSGTYTEQFRIRKIVGTSANDTVVFQSETGNANDVIITYASSQLNNYILLLDSAEYIYFKNLSFEAANASYASIIELEGTAKYNTIDSCNLLSTGTSSNNKAIYTTSSNVTYNTISNNYIKYGYTGIYLYTGSTALRAKGNTINNNTIDSVYYYGIYMYGQDSCIIKNNYITNSNGSGGLGTGTFYGMYIYYSDNGIEISGNNLVLNSTSSNYGIYFYQSNGSLSQPNQIYNNMIAIHSPATSTNQPFRIYYSNYNDFYYNTLYTNGVATSSSNSCVYLYGSSTTSSSNNTFKNNIFYSKNSGYTVYCSNSSYASNTTFDYNVHFTNSSNMAYWSGNKSDLAAWQATGFGANSLFADPSFNNLPDLHCKSPLINNQGTPIAGITLDIDGDTRNATTPDIGADEFDPPLNDAAITTLLNPSAPCDGTTEDIIIKLANYGLNPLASATINWSINGTPKTPLNYAGTLNTNQDTVLTLGNFTFFSGTSYDIQVYVSNPNGSIDEDNANDTLLASGIETAMPGGIFTIDPAQPAGGTNYQSFSAAIADLVSNGLCSSIIFNVASGTYNEQVYIPEIRGTGPGVTVTFQSATGDSTDVILTHASTSTSNNYVLGFNQSSYINFKSMTFTNTGTSYSTLIHMENEANHINIENSVLRGSGQSSTSSYHSGVYTPSASNCHHIGIKNCNIGQVGYGLYLYTGSANIISNNQIEFYYRGAHLYYQDSLIFHGNNVQSLNPGYSSPYAVYLYYSNYFEITANNITVNGTSTNYCIYAYYASGGTTKSLIANNFLKQLGTTSTSTNAPIYLSSYCSDINIVHNSFYTEANSASNRCIYMTSTGVTGINLTNNIFYNAGGNGYIIYLVSLASIDTMDYNCYYNTPGATFAYVQGARNSLSALQSYTGKDQHSLNIDPQYLSNTNLHTYNSMLKGAGIGLGYVNKDIDGDPRDPLTPDIGADEFEPPQYDAGVVAVISPDGMNNTGIDLPFKIRFRNYGLQNITSIDVTYELNGGAPQTQTWTGSLPYLDTASIFISNNQLIGGVNTIKAYTTLTGDTLAFNDTLSTQCFGVYPVKLYFNDFETVTDDWTVSPGSVLWQVGAPTMQTINNAYSGNNVWATRLNGVYFGNRSEYIISKKFSFLMLNNVQVGFYHWFLGDGGEDGGYLEYSTDDGVTWQRLGYQGDPASFNWYDGGSTTTGGQSWLHNTEGWIASVYDYSANLPLFPPIQFRLYFKSNPTTSNDGWAIDDFGIYVPRINKDASAIEINSPSGLLHPGTSHTVTITLHNPGMDVLTSIPVTYQAMNTGMPPFSGTWTGTLQPDSTTTYTFPIPFTVPALASFKLCAFTKLQQDYHAFNDTTCQIIETSMGIADGDINGLALWQNAPNPANTFTKISYQIPETGDLRFEIINILGQTINSLEIPEQIKGKHEIEMDVNALESGIYYIRMTYNNQSLSNKMIIAR